MEHRQLGPGQLSPQTIGPGTIEPRKNLDSRHNKDLTFILSVVPIFPGFNCLRAQMLGLNCRSTMKNVYIDDTKQQIKNQMHLAKTQNDFSTQFSDNLN